MQSYLLPKSKFTKTNHPRKLHAKVTTLLLGDLYLSRKVKEMKLLLLVTIQQVACLRVELQPINLVVMVKHTGSYTTGKQNLMYIFSPSEGEMVNDKCSFMGTRRTSLTSIIQRTVLRSKYMTLFWPLYDYVESPLNE